MAHSRLVPDQFVLLPTPLHIGKQFHKELAREQKQAGNQAY
jgi:hypothetical protein